MKKLRKWDNWLLFFFGSISKSFLCQCSFLPGHIFPTQNKILWKFYTKYILIENTF